ncbi:hypothetical protein GU700_00890 [Methylobacterium sp. NI91]|nr:MULTISPECIES: hypothetical protein [unclassified Methylobacterium]QIJ73290.1 hypothetical protein CLZ_00890 [Methylobacterium sp. CLZ]QIJ78194.1 hypothetical protein GU700_00890 [Methylobacterium sp. NI91]
MSTVIPFFRPASARQGNWSQQELAEFYRVEAALLRAGFSIASEHGLSDEGEPWFVFCRPDGDAIIHFAKIDGSYLIASEALDRPVQGTDFRTLIDQIARLHPHLLPIPATGTATTLVVHPAALLAALVAAAALSLSSEDAHAGPLVPGGEGVSAAPVSEGGRPPLSQPQPKASGGSGDRDTDRKQLEAIILSAMIFAAEAMAVDHRAASAELDLDFAGGAGNAWSPTAQGDATLTPGTALGSGRGSASVQPAVLTAQGSGANPDARPQSASDTIAAPSRVDPAPVARTEFASEAPKSPASQNQPLAPGFGSDVALTGTSAEVSAAKSSGHQASTSARSEGAAPTSDEPGPASRDQRAGSASASIAEPASHARPGHAASSDPASTGSGPARPAWVNDLTQTMTSRMPSPDASRDADDRSHGRPTEAALGNGRKVDPTGPGNGRVDGAGRDREPSAKAADETHQTKDQAAPGHSQAGSGQGRGVPAETATGNTPPAEQARPVQGPVDRADQDRGASAMAAVGRSPNAEQAAPGSSQASARDQDPAASSTASHEMRAEQTGPINGQVNPVGPDRASSPEGASGNDPQTVPAGGGNGHTSGLARGEAAPAQAEAANGPPVEPSSRGSGNAGAIAQERGPQAETTTGSKLQNDQTGGGNDHASVVARQEAAPAQTEAGNPSPVGQTGQGSSHAGGVARDRPPQAEAAAGTNPRPAQAGPSESRAEVSGPGSARAEAVDDRPEVQQAGRANGQENANEQGSLRQSGAAPGNDPRIETTGGNDDQGPGSHSQPESVAQREPGSGGPAIGRDRSPSDANERGSTAQAEAARPKTEQEADRGNGHSSAPAERSDQRMPEAQGPGATDTVSNHGRPDTPGDAPSDAASTTTAHPPLDSGSATRGSNKPSATELPDGRREPIDRAAPEHAAAAERTPVAADGPAQQLTSPPSEHGRGNSIGPSADHASNAAASEQTNGDVAGTKEHGSGPNDTAVASSSNVHVGGAGPQASHAQDEPASHGHDPAAEAPVPASVARDPILQDRGSDRAVSENSVGHGASLGSDALNASAKGEQTQAEIDGSHDGTGPVVVRASPAAGPKATVHGVDENGLSVPSDGSNPTSPPAPVSQDEIATAQADRAQFDDSLSVSGRAVREVPGHAAPPVSADPPTVPSVPVEADRVDGPSPTSQSSSAASHGTSGQAKPGRPSPPPAAIDADGNLVFHTDAQKDPVPSALPQGPDEATSHHAIGLIGVSDQAHSMHDLYHQT